MIEFQTYQSAASGNRSRIAGLRVGDATRELWPLAEGEESDLRLYINMSVVNSILGGQSPPRVAPRGIKLVQLCNSWPEKIKKSSMFTYLPATLRQTVNKMKFA